VCPSLTGPLDEHPFDDFSSCHCRVEASAPGQALLSERALSAHFRRHPGLLESGGDPVVLLWAYATSQQHVDQVGLSAALRRLYDLVRHITLQCMVM
jgi:hypothetical protein